MIGRSALVRRAFLLASVFYVAGFLAGSVFAIEGPLGVQVSVHEEENGFYRVEGQILVQAAAKQAWAVLTDYEQISSYVSSLKTSRVVSREAGFILLEQVSRNNIWFISNEIRVRLKVKEAGDKVIYFEDLANESFQSYQGSWKMVDRGQFRELDYNLRVKPNLGFLGFLTKGLVRGQIEDQIKSLLIEVKSEIIRRGKDGTSGS